MHLAVAGNIGSGKTTLTTLLAKHYRYGTDPSELSDTSKVTERVSAGNVKKSAKRFFNTKRYVDGTLLPEGDGKAATGKVKATK